MHGAHAHAHARERVHLAHVHGAFKALALHGEAELDPRVVHPPRSEIVLGEALLIGLDCLLRDQLRLIDLK